MHATFAAGNVKLPKFWEDDAELWFSTAEATFTIKGIHSETLKLECLLALASLDRHHVRHISHVISAENCVKPFSIEPLTSYQGWKPGYLALGCQFQFRCVETQMSGLSFGLVSRLLKNRFQFQFQFCLRAASVSGFQFRFKFHPRKLFYCEYELFKSSTFWCFCFITMISSSSDGRVRRAIASEVVNWGIIPSPMKPRLKN